MRIPISRLFRSIKPSLFVMAGAATAGALAFTLSGDSSNAATQYTANVGGGAAGIAVETFRPAVIFVNQGDSVKFVNPYEEIHTVTYAPDGKPIDFIVPSGPPPKNGPPTLIVNPKLASPSPASPASFDGTVFANSGILMKGDSYTITFTQTGKWTFVCEIHPGMTTAVSVLPAGVHVPTQAQRDYEADVQLKSDLAKGEAASAAAPPTTRTAGAGGASNWTVSNVASVGPVDIMRFFPARLQVGAGDTVTWNNTTFVPHTVTFLGGSQAPDLITPQFQATGGPPTLVINPRALFPSQAPPVYDGTGYMNSGFIEAGPEATHGTSFSLTFTRPGTYSYICLLHADQGMAGVIEVGAAGSGVGATSASSAGGGSVATIRAPSTGDGGLIAGPRSGTEASMAAILVLSLTGGLAGAATYRSRSHNA